MKTFLVIVALLMLGEMFRNLGVIGRNAMEPAPRNRAAFALCVNVAVLTWAACLLFL